MSLNNNVKAILLAFLMSLAAQAGPVSAQFTAGIGHNAAKHDGQHDFDFELGAWQAHVKTLPRRLSGSHAWEEFNGTVVTKPFMDGKGNLSEMSADSQTGGKRIQIIAVRLYNPSSGQWSIYGASAKTGSFDPAQVGQFEGKQGEFYAADTYEGRAILIRFVWTNLSPDRTHMEQAFSADGGKFWEVNWIYDGTRMGEAPGRSLPLDHKR